MKYLVEINSDSAKGSQLMKYIEELKATENDIHILNEAPLTDEEMAKPPARYVSEATMDAWLKPGDNEQGFTCEEALEYIRKKREGGKKSEGDES